MAGTRIIYNASATTVDGSETIESMVWGSDDETATASMQEWLDMLFPGREWVITILGPYVPLGG